jgi:hypothetical protein
LNPGIESVLNEPPGQPAGVASVALVKVNPVGVTVPEPTVMVYIPKRLSEPPLNDIEDAQLDPHRKPVREIVIPPPRLMNDGVDDVLTCCAKVV